MRFWIAALALLFASDPSLAQERATAKPGEEVRLGWIGSVGEGCKANPAPTVRPKQVPAHGQIILRPAQVTTKSVAACGTITVPAVVVFYKSAAGYVGADGFALTVVGGGAPSERSYSVEILSNI